MGLRCYVENAQLFTGSVAHNCREHLGIHRDRHTRRLGS